VGGYRENPSAEVGIQYASARYARDVAYAVGKDMRNMCPVDTGELWSSISLQVVGETVYISVGTDHWHFVEFGTSKMAAQPFIRPALNRRRGVVGLGGGVA
jgi:HK97 gp10 family phage protein